MRKPVIRWGMLLVIIGLVMLSACAAKGASTGKGDEFEASIYQSYPDLKKRLVAVTEVKRVVDGDTFETKNGDKVRLIGVNTPETVKPGSPVEKFGKQASDYTKKRLTGQTVYLYKDTGEKDKYGRLLCYVFLKGEPVMYNETLVREGYANVMSVPPNVMYQDKFVKLEREARQQKRGLWADEKK
ncbi:thermonuclease family protein [Paenibacillus silviterrae]|uniref:thermonuclease family protein n=1 Tax=Paenibacillus silviterrae TaxID=3242194 RepID=UPI0025433881|nr:thermonuclease family protein [Paenibacillus chinjuensis]